MSERPKFFDDLAGMAGGAMSALQGLRDEFEAMAKARMEETIRKLELVKREQLEALAEVATKAREGQLIAEAKLTALESRIAALEAHAAPAPAIPLPDQTPPAPLSAQDPPPTDPIA